MKNFLRTFVFSFISIKSAGYVLNALSFDDPYPSSFFLFVTAVSLLYFLLKPTLKMLSLPQKGVGYVFILFLMTVVIINVLVVLIPRFSINPTEISNFIIFGFVLPSKNLTRLWSGIYSALIISLVYSFFDWLGEKK